MQEALKSDKTTIIDILAASFLDNKSVNHIIPQDRLKIYRIHQLMDYAFELCMLFGKVYISDDKKACSLIIYPDIKTHTIKSIWLEMKLVLNCTGFYYAVEAIKREKKIKMIHPQDRIAYLWFIGVDPKYQKFGLGKKLMQEIIISTKQNGRPIYLETSNLSNLPWYKKFGFEVYHHIDLSYRLFFLQLPLTSNRYI